MIIQPRIFELFRVDADAGRLFWKSPPKNHSRLLGLEAGCPRRASSGKLYWHIKIGARAYKRAHLIFCAVHGRWPSPLCDHKDGDSLNDRPENLREATTTQNAWNHKARSRRIRLPMGVRHMASGRFQARISHYGRQLHLGTYETPEQASAVYAAKRKELFGDYA